MEDKIKELIEKDINPVLLIHNGSCDFISYENGVVAIKLNGGCAGCPSAKITLFNGIIPIFKDKLPEIQNVILA